MEISNSPDLNIRIPDCPAVKTNNIILDGLTGINLKNTKTMITLLNYDYNIIHPTDIESYELIRKLATPQSGLPIHLEPKITEYRHTYLLQILEVLYCFNYERTKDDKKVYDGIIDKIIKTTNMFESTGITSPP